jgi:cytochrome b pre-mRNA-processing protein 3
MIFHLFRRTPRSLSIAPLYGTIVAQARSAAFYQTYGVPDTVNGRFEMVVLHTVLLLRRLAAEPEPVRQLGQGVFDHFCRDMDANLREMGVGDLAVPRKMRSIGEAFYGRQQVYDAALAAPAPAELAVALSRNVYGMAERLHPGVARLTAYVRAAVRRLSAQDGETLRRGVLAFPNPDQISVEEAPLTYSSDDKDDETRAHG